MPRRTVSPPLRNFGGFMPDADARRRAGGDDVARLEQHELADIADEMRDAEDHRLGVAGLHALAVDVEEHVEVLRRP